MKFAEVITIDWYDNILKAFCKTHDGTIFYCCVLAISDTTNYKIYLRTEIKYLKGHKELIQIIEENSFKEHWDYLSKLIALKAKNVTQLIKTKDLLTDDVDLVDYKQNYKWPKSIVWAIFRMFWTKRKKLMIGGHIMHKIQPNCREVLTRDKSLLQL